MQASREFLPCPIKMNPFHRYKAVRLLEGAAAFFPQSPDSLRCWALFYLSRFIWFKHHQLHPPKKNRCMGKRVLLWLVLGADGGCGLEADGQSWEARRCGGGGGGGGSKIAHVRRWALLIFMLHLRCFSIWFHSFPYGFTVKCKAEYIFHQQSFQGLDKKWILQKSSYEDSAVCAFLYAYMCVCVCVYQSVCFLLRASERLISLIEAHRRPSTPRPRGIAADTHKK